MSIIMSSDHSLFFDELKVGMEWITSGRTIAEADLVLYSNWSWDVGWPYTDEDYCKKHGKGIFKEGRMVQGVFGLVIAQGLIVMIGRSITANSAAAFMGLDNVRFKKPIRIGDTLHVKLTAVDLKEPKPGSDIGVGTFHGITYNQRDEEVQVWDMTMGIRKKPVGK